MAALCGPTGSQVRSTMCTRSARKSGRGSLWLSNFKYRFMKPPLRLHAAPGNLDAWSAYHLGLQHLYRFNRLDNVAAEALFQQSISLDPYFARAHAGLSFIHFQTAFMRYSDHIDEDVVEARRFAERAVEAGSFRPVRQFHDGTHILA